MSKFLTTAAAAALLATLPMTASAFVASGSLSDGLGGINSGATFTLSTGAFDLSLTDFVDGDIGGTFTFDFLNDTGSAVQVTLAEGTVAQTSGDSFTGGVSLSFQNGGSDSVAQGETAVLGPLFVSIAANATETLSLTFGDVVLGAPGNSVGLDIDFSVAPVPLPAPLALLLAGVAGLGFAGYRKSRAEA